MANYSDEEFAARAKAITQETQSSTTNSAPDQQQGFSENLRSLFPRTESALGSVNAPPSQIGASLRSSFLERNQRPGVPLDISRDTIPNFEYWQIAEQTGPEAQLERTKQLYPKSNARILDSGDIVVEVNDSKTGKPKDVAINPAGMDAHDLLDLAVQTPELAANLATFLATKGRGTLRTAAAMISSALVGEETGQLRDVIARSTAGIPIKPEEIKNARSEQAALDLIFQTIAGPAGKLVGKMISPFGGPTGRIFNPEAAQQFFKKWFGEDIKLLPGEVTGSSMLGKVEAYESKQPGASTIVSNIKRAGEQSIQRIRDAALGPLNPEEEIGMAAQRATQRQVSMPLETAVENARNYLESKGLDQTVKTLDSITKPAGAGVSKLQAGGALRQAYGDAYESADKAVKDAYAEVAKFPEQKEKLIPTDSMYDAAQEIRKEIPSALKEVTETTTSPLLDQFGRRSTQTVTSMREQPLKSAVPEGLELALKDMENQKGATMSLDGLTKLKNSAYDEIAKTQAVPGVKERWFGLVAKAYEEGIQSGIDATGNTDLKQALTNARDTYKSRMLPFETQGIRDIPIPSTESGFKSEEQLTQRLFSGEQAQHNYRALKTVLGAGNPVFKTLNRSLVDGWLEESTDQLTKKINPDNLLKVFQDFRSNQPDTFKEIFQGKGDDLEAGLRAMKLSRIPDLDMGEVQGLINSGRFDKVSIQNLVKATQERDQAYLSSLVRASAQGASISQRIKPVHFVDRLLKSDTPTADVKTVLNALEKEDPSKRDALSTAVMYRIISDASEEEGGRLVNLSQSKLDAALGAKNSDQRKRIQLLLGEKPIPMFAGKLPDPGSATVPPAPGIPPIKGAPTRMQVLENMASILGPRQQIEKTFSTAGGMASGSQIANILKKPLEYADSFVKKLFAASLYTSDLGLRVASNRLVDDASSAAIANSLIASEPFARAVMEMTGNETEAKYVIANARSSIHRFVNDVVTHRNQASAEREKFLAGKRSQFKMEPAQYAPRNDFSIRQ